MTTDSAPLAGLVVIELGHSVAAPFAGQILADLGAEVIKVEKAGIPCARVQNVAEMIAHEQTEALGLMQAVPGSAMTFVGLPLSFDGTRPAIRSRPPRLGEHTEGILNTKES